MAWMIRSLIGSIDRRTDGGDGLANRTMMALEELAEWIESHLAGDLKAAADAWADRAYLLFGDAVATGLGTEAVFDEVHRSNMTKAPVNPATGKAVKSDGYLAPVISLYAAKEVAGWKHSASG
jgi:predicted HAD superfamily Cof-like phosphohydrolase